MLQPWWSSLLIFSSFAFLLLFTVFEFSFLAMLLVLGLIHITKMHHSFSIAQFSLYWVFFSCLVRPQCDHNRTVFCIRIFILKKWRNVYNSGPIINVLGFYRKWLLFSIASTTVLMIFVFSFGVWCKFGLVA